MLPAVYFNFTVVLFDDLAANGDVTDLTAAELDQRIADTAAAFGLMLVPIADAQKPANAATTPDQENEAHEPHAQDPG